MLLVGHLLVLAEHLPVLLAAGHWMMVLTEHLLVVLAEHLLVLVMEALRRFRQLAQPC